MNPIKWSYEKARGRLDKIQQWATPAESYVLTVLFMEKIVRRTLLQLVIRKGQSFDAALAVVKKLHGIRPLSQNWRKYDPDGKTLKEIVGDTDFDILDSGAENRNELVHGSGHNRQRFYEKKLPSLLATLDSIRNKFSSTYGYSGWKGLRDANGKKIQ